MQKIPFLLNWLIVGLYDWLIVGLYMAYSWLIVWPWNCSVIVGILVQNRTNTTPRPSGGGRIARRMAWHLPMAGPNHYPQNPPQTHYPQAPPKSLSPNPSKITILKSPQNHYPQIPWKSLSPNPPQNYYPQPPSKWISPSLPKMLKPRFTLNEYVQKRSKWESTKSKKMTKCRIIEIDHIDFVYFSVFSRSGTQERPNKQKKTND